MTNDFIKDQMFRGCMWNMKSRSQFSLYAAGCVPAGPESVIFNEH